MIKSCCPLSWWRCFRRQLRFVIWRRGYMYITEQWSSDSSRALCALCSSVSDAFRFCWGMPCVGLILHDVVQGPASLHAFVFVTGLSHSRVSARAFNISAKSGFPRLTLLIVWPHKNYLVSLLVSRGSMILSLKWPFCVLSWSYAPTKDSCSPVLSRPDFSLFHLLPLNVVLSFKEAINKKESFSKFT